MKRKDERGAAKSKWRSDDPERTSREVRMARRNLLGCSMCPPHKNENAKRQRRHPKKPKYKSHRRN